MDVDRARTFLEIVRGGSFMAAADRLNVTQTTVSARVRTLEDVLGRKLFVRNRRGAQLTPAGEEFQRYAQSFVQVWERARHHLAVPAGRTSVVAIGGELSLWNPLLLDWLVWMRHAEPDIAVRAHVALPDQLMDQLRSGVLDVAVLYAPRLDPGFEVEPLMEEKLILVRSTRIPAGERDAYVYVDWGPQFAAQHETSFPARQQPDLFVGLGPLGLNYILRAGGTGYFRKRVVQPYLKSGELEVVESAPEFSYPAYVVSLQEGSDRRALEPALTGLREVARSVG